MSNFISRIAFVTFHLSHCICHIAFVTLHLSNYICHSADITLHLSHCTCYIALVTFHMPHCMCPICKMVFITLFLFIIFFASTYIVNPGPTSRNAVFRSKSSSITHLIDSFIDSLCKTFQMAIAISLLITFYPDICNVTLET